MSSTPGVMLCGAIIQLGSDTDVFAQLIGLEGFGFSRAAVDDGSAADKDGLQGRILSCIATMKPFRVRVKFESERRWDEKILAAAEMCTINWPLKAGQLTPDISKFPAGITDVTVSGDYQSRLETVYEITPTGRGAPDESATPAAYGFTAATDTP